MRNDIERLRDILEAIERIERFTGRCESESAFDELVLAAVVHNILIIGEACSRLSESFRADHAEIPWASIVAMRNIIVHEYFEVDPDEIFRVVDTDLPKLKESIIGIIGL